MEKKLVARWETRGKRYWYELYSDRYGCTYKGDGCGGNLGNITVVQAIVEIEKMVESAKRIDKINYKRVL